MSFKIPLFDLNFDHKEEEAVIETLRSKWISTGPKSTLFEEKFAELLGANYAVSLANCTVALHLAFKLCDLKAGDEVICPSLTFVATCNAIMYTGATPVFADVESLERPVICPEDIKSKITPKTKAIVVMHYAGFACDMDAIMKLAEENNLFVIEDACHAPNSEYNGKKLGTIGHVGCFSFFSNKNLSTGEGGMLVTNSEAFYERTKLLRSHGMTTLSYERSKGHSTGYDVIDLGYNYRMDDIRASIGLVQLQKFESDLLLRAKVREWYEQELEKIPHIIVPFKKHKEFVSNYIMPIVIEGVNIEKRDEMRKNLADNGIQTSMHYPAVHRFSIYADFYTELPTTDAMVNQMITLPMYAKLSKDEVFYVCEILKSTIS